MANDDDEKKAAAIKETKAILRRHAESPDEISLNTGMKEAAAPMVKLFAEDIERRRQNGATEAEIELILTEAERLITAEVQADQAHVVMGELRKSIRK